MHPYEQAINRINERLFHRQTIAAIAEKTNTNLQPTRRIDEVNDLLKGAKWKAFGALYDKNKDAIERYIALRAEKAFLEKGIL